MIYDNDTDHEAIKKIRNQVETFEYLVDPTDIRTLLVRFEKLLHDYDSSNDHVQCPHCRKRL